jgi:hypothetical protein
MFMKTFLQIGMNGHNRGPAESMMHTSEDLIFIAILESRLHKDGRNSEEGRNSALLRAAASVPQDVLAGRVTLGPELELSRHPPLFTAQRAAAVRAVLLRKR